MIAFAILAAVAIFLATVSFFPQAAPLYSSWGAVALWGALAVAATVSIVRRRLWHRPAVFALHVAFLVILAGALTTKLWGTSQTLHLSVGQSADVAGRTLVLRDFRIEYYSGTAAPADFVATVGIDGQDASISMNRVGRAGGCRIFLKSCSPDGSECTFTVTSDAAGTALSYAGYALLLLSMLACSLPRPRAVRAAVLLGLIGAAPAAFGAGQALPADVAQGFGSLMVYHGDRVAPVSTLARDFSLKVYGTTSYDGLTPEQVLTGWLFYYDSWKNDPGIRIKDADTRRVLGAEADRYRLTDFFGPEGYLFDDAAHPEANEKFALVSRAASGSLWRLFPYRADSTSTASAVLWFAPTDALPEEIPLDDWRMTRHSLSYLAELAAEGNWERLKQTLSKIERYQHLRCPGNMLPSEGQVCAERLFLGGAASLWPVLILLIGGIALLVWPCPVAARLLLTGALLWVASLTALNWYASGHIPMANGYETMQWMALWALAVCLLLGHKRPAVLPLGAIVAALALAVALMGQRDPQLTNLMPVLRSPLLSIHVLAVMLAYALLAIMALASAMWLCGRRTLLPLARAMLRPAVFLLAAGIFIGAVWANMSWGRYWGWDPKEVWALITMIVYSFALHGATLPVFRRDKFFAWWTLLSFATVLMTYAGVNFVLGGLHSYA